MKDSAKKNGWEGSSGSVEYKPGAGPFLALLLVSSIGICAVAFFIWYVPSVGLSHIHPALPFIAGAVLLSIAAFVVAGALVLGIMTITKRPLFYSKSFHWLLVKLFLPIMILIGGALKMPRIRIERAFIEINNNLVRQMGRRCRPGKLLLLMPHCIQYDNCRIKVTRDVKNCAGCGKCEIGELLSLTDEFGLDLFISTGGTVARRTIVEKQPHAVIAVACERDLTSGLQDAFPLPVLAIVNKRPRGYCMETGVDISEVRQAIKDLLTT